MVAPNKDHPMHHPTGQMRILETTDLHMHLLGHDYFADRDDGTFGLARLADVITARRKGACLLFDNGDFLQGTPLADVLAARQCHPLAEAFNTLGYDAITLGNHEFDYGTGALALFCRQLDAPLVSANVATVSGGQDWRPFRILTRAIPCCDGKSRKIRIGVTGFAPPSLTKAKGIVTRPFAAAARDTIAAMKGAGADLIVVLCHAGIGGAEDESARSLAAVDGIDVILMGHTHDSFPDPAGVGTDKIDHVKGTICGKPAVMAGYHGTSLGEIDLDLCHQPDGWRVTGHNVRLHPIVETQVPPSPARELIEALAIPAHQSHLLRMRMPLGRSGQPLNNHFATVVPDPVARLLAKIMRETVARAIAIPCPVAAVAPFQPAGAKGRQRRITLPAGGLTYRDAICLFPFRDRLCALRQTGRQLRAWLARSAMHYAQVLPVRTAQPLINPNSADYFCDGLFGLQYRIDLAQPAKADNLDRIADMRFAGRPVGDSESFIVAATGFRRQGGGGFPVIAREDVLWTSDQSLQEIVTDAIAAGAAEDIPPEHVWSFSAAPGTTLFLEHCAGDADTLPPDWLRSTDGTGYLRYF
jgi:2',3'-cyclic-nucleotide 2'-phosphodiesterase/3'-nucleotidase